MDLFKLVATLGLDSSGFSTGIVAAQDLFSNFAQAVVGFSRDVMNTGLGFDQAMSNVQAVLGEQEGTVERMNTLRAFALEQARTSVFTAEDTARAYYYMGMAGWKSEQMMAGLPGIMALAAASGEDLGMVSDIVTDSLTAFRLTADDTQRYVDILAQTATNANTNVALMGETFKYVAPVAGALGYSVEDVALSIGLMANAGIKGSMAGTALRNMFTRIATDAGASDTKLGALGIVTQKLGVQFYDAHRNARPWMDVLTEMRAAWQGLDKEADRNKILDAFSEMSTEGIKADEVLDSLYEDIRSMQGPVAELLNDAEDGKISEAGEKAREEIAAIGKAYDPVLEKLNIKVNPNSYMGYYDALQQMYGTLRDLNDQEKINYANQIASLRAMSGFLNLMEGPQEDMDQLAEAYENAAGAAQRMADVRLGSLAGDIVYFNSAMDGLRIAIYDDVKGPLRDVVQWGTDAINDITDAINEKGLAGGIEMLGAKVEEAGDRFAPLLESIGRAAGPLVDALFESVMPRLVDAGEKLAAGLLKGLGDGLAGSDSVVMDLLGMVLGGAGYGLDGLSALLKWLGFGPGNKSVSEDNSGWLLPPEMQPDQHVDLFVDPLLAPDAVSGIESDLAGIGTGGMEDAIASAGQSGGARAKSNIESEINSGTYSINVAATVSGLPGMPFQHNASAMEQGRIFTRPTVFGVANGAYQVAGDAGPEAVVGTGSLSSMIRRSVDGSVAAAMSGMLDRLGGIAERMTGYAPKIYLDGRTLVGQLAPEMNGQLNDIAEWKGYGRA